MPQETYDVQAENVCRMRESVKSNVCTTKEIRVATVDNFQVGHVLYRSVSSDPCRQPHLYHAIWKLELCSLFVLYVQGEEAKVIILSTTRYGNHLKLWDADSLA
eukprot:466454-Pelagomonas_calceolata.AAC.6